ncbi:DUF5071 domain-containing protein [Sporosarcina sp. HYO08]|uniref:DUF5071 domain-containing protein n=1 Tax=Sporosarcina sp. HYO08 TaxID=1759557 RepID=UPI0007980AA8|nr:DUF5071 domain-containing protein [Sporosarcina sp. HYO08]KXH86078.1 tartrate dehydratase [Sporosarcina sp. HYO08]
MVFNTNTSEKYLPRNKYDFSRVNHLKSMNRSELSFLLPGLMEWIQDMNWPIATEVAELLLTFPNEIVPLVKDVLDTNDDVWKYWCLECLVKRFPVEFQMQLKDDLVRLVENPTTGEKLEELDQIARETLLFL